MDSLIFMVLMIHLIKFNFSSLGGQLEKRSRWIHVQHTTGTEACQSCSWNLKITCPRRIKEFKSLWAYPKNSNNNKGKEKVNNPEKGKAFIAAVLLISVIFVSKTYWFKTNIVYFLYMHVSVIWHDLNRSSLQWCQITSQILTQWPLPSSYC